MNDQPCPDESQLESLVAGRLPAETSAVIAAHIDTCARCRTVVSRMVVARASGANVVEPERDRTLDPPPEGAWASGADRLAPTVDMPVEPPVSSDGSPSHVGRYFLIRRLGRGAFGAVYLASDPDHQRLVAVKLSRVDRSSSEFVEMFREEARAAAGLDHPHVVRVFDYGETPDGRCYLVMRYVDGKPLSELLRAGAVDFRKAAAIVAGAARGLHCAHQNGLIHRDVKPANILIDRDGAALVADFGLAVPDRRRLGADEYAGTEAYMAPEQIRSADEMAGTMRHLDARTDVWSLGVVLYELLTKCRPFEGASSDERRERICHGEPRAPRLIDERIPVELERVALDCLRKSPAERPATAADVAERLERWLAPPGGSSRRRWLIAGGAAAIGVVGAALLGGRLARRPPLLEMEAPLGEPLPLLKYEPTVAIAAEGPNPAPSYVPSRQAYTIDCNGETLVRLGATRARDFDVQVMIRKTHWKGESGLCFGLDVDSLRPGEWTKCVQLTVRDEGDGMLSLQCITASLTPTDGRVDVRAKKRHSAATIVTPGLQPGLLEVQVRSSRLHMVRWNGAFAPHTFYDRLPEDLHLADHVGLTNRDGSATFERAEFTWWK